DGVAVETINGSKGLPQANGSRPRRRGHPPRGGGLGELVLGGRPGPRRPPRRGPRPITPGTPPYTRPAPGDTPRPFFPFVLEQGANLGRARFELQRAGATLAQNL